MKYASYPVSKTLSGEISCYWSIQNGFNEKAHCERVYSTGTTQLLFHYGRPFEQKIGSSTKVQPQTLFTGHMLQYNDVTALPGSGMFAVVFKPHTLRRFVDIPMHLTNGVFLEFGDLFPKHAHIAQRIAEADNDYCRIAIIESFFLSVRKMHPSTHYFLAQYALGILEKDTTFSRGLAALSELELSERQIERIFQDYIGISPRDFLKISKVNKAVAILNEYPRLTDIAFECGYFDQAHFIRSFKSLTGLTPGEYRHYNGES